MIEAIAYLIVGIVMAFVGVAVLVGALFVIAMVVAIPVAIYSAFRPRLDQ